MIELFPGYYRPLKNAIVIIDTVSVNGCDLILSAILV